MSILPPENQSVNTNVVPTSTPANVELAEYIYHNHPPEGVDLRLSAVSSRDSIWDTQRAKTSVIGEIYALNSEFERYSERMADCSGFLGFGLGSDGFKLKQASFCRVRLCPVCQWRRSLLWRANMYFAYEDIKEKYPSHRWVFLTLTIKNVPVKDLRSTLKQMNTAYKRLIQRKQFDKVVDGFIRTTEVTRGKDGTAHPHFHAMLLVKPSYFSQGYIKQVEWQRLWQDCLKVDYLPVVDVRAIRAKKGYEDTEDNKVKAGILETLKYAVKPSDMVSDPEWFYELTRQLKNTRAVSTGGALKDAIKKENEIKNDDMVNTGSEDGDDTDERRWVFVYNKRAGYYAYSPKHNQ